MYLKIRVDIAAIFSTIFRTLYPVFEIELIITATDYVDEEVSTSEKAD
jgi:hypothetical protein